MRQTYDGNPVYDHARFLEDFLLKNNLRYGAELGVWRGNTTIYLLKKIENLSLVAVDNWEGNHIRHKEHFLSRIGGLDGRLTIHHMSTDEACTHVDDNSLDFVFIDADHNYRSVKKDIKNWTPKIKISGFLMGHDRNHPGVNRALSELIPKHKTGAGGCWYIGVTDEIRRKVSAVSGRAIYRPVCQVQREIMFFAQKLPDCPEKQAIIDRVNEALRMSKSMNERLIQLQPGVNKKIWSTDHSDGRVFGPRKPQGD